MNLIQRAGGARKGCDLLTIQQAVLHTLLVIVFGKLLKSWTTTFLPAYLILIAISESWTKHTKKIGQWILIIGQDSYSR